MTTTLQVIAIGLPLVVFPLCIDGHKSKTPAPEMVEASISRVVSISDDIADLSWDLLITTRTKD